MPSEEDKRLRDALVRDLDGLPLRVRGMFGGYGLYMEDAFFGVVFDGKVYFRTDEGSRPAYVDRGMRAFQPSSRPRGKRTVDRNFEVPADVLGEPEALRAWARRAARAGRD